VRMDGHARRALSEMVDDFHQVVVSDGVMTVVDFVHPSRNVHEWKQSFGELIGSLRGHASAIAGSELTVGLEDPDQKMTLELGLKADTSGLRPRVRMRVEARGEDLATIEILRSRLEKLGMTIEELEKTDDGLKSRGVVDGDSEAMARSLGKQLRVLVVYAPGAQSSDPM
jgi:hypothetical protein